MSNRLVTMEWMHSILFCGFNFEAYCRYQGSSERLPVACSYLNTNAHHISHYDCETATLLLDTIL